MRLRIFMLGVTFYRNDTLTDTPAFREDTITVKDIGKINIQFYTKRYIERRFRFGFFRNVDRLAYILRAKIDGQFDDEVYHYNRTDFTFLFNKISRSNQQAVAQVLLETYVDYLYKELSIG